MIAVTRMKIVLIGANNPETIRMINSLKKTSPNFEVKGFLDNDPKKLEAPFMDILFWVTLFGQKT